MCFQWHYNPKPQNRQSLAVFKRQTELLAEIGSEAALDWSNVSLVGGNGNQGQIEDRDSQGRRPPRQLVASLQPKGALRGQPLSGSDA
jgi:hypothetical protein